MRQFAVFRTKKFSAEILTLSSSSPALQRSLAIGFMDF